MNKEPPPSFPKMLAHAVAAGYVRPAEELKPLSPEEQARATEISNSNLSAAEAKRLRRQQRNLKLQGLPSGT